MSFNLQQLTEGIRQRHVGTQNKRLVEKWNRTGLLRGLDDVSRENMSTLLENQAAQVLREANTLGGSAGSSDIRGFANIAFPIVRRVFGGLVANELVSIQPMSLPSGLLFYLDYTYGSDVGGDRTNNTSAVYQSGSSIYNNPTGKGIQEGSLGAGGQYDLVGSGFSRVHALTALSSSHDDLFNEHGGYNAAGTWVTDTGLIDSTTVVDASNQKLLQFDSQLITRVEDGTDKLKVVFLDLNSTQLAGADLTKVKDLSLVVKGTTAPASVLQAIPDALQGGRGVYNIRRLNELGTWDASNKVFTPDPFAKLGESNAVVKLIVKVASSATLDTSAELGATGLDFVKLDTFSADASGGDTLTVPSFESAFTSNQPDAAPVIPEIDIKIESIPVTAQTRKLRARWSPELAQDLNAYHSMDAEVELTQILSEQIALEIDREILNDLLTQAKGANYYWSRSPGKFVNKASGAEIARTSTLTPGPAFTGTVREWYETLTETVIDVANEIHRKTLRGSANFIVVSPDVATILEASVLYRPAYSLDGDGQVGAPFTMGAEKIGTLSNRFTVYKDPYFPRNKILVGYKGGSYLETGFVYAPYVPLIVTPTIFAPEDFTPRKGVMTRYGKKMVRADFYGTVTCLDMNVI